jgi:hypothetical protein
MLSFSQHFSRVQTIYHKPNKPMKTTSNIFTLFTVSLFMLTTAGCQKDEAGFVMENAPYTGKFTWATKSTGTYSFAGAVTLNDEFELDYTTGKGIHKAIWTDTKGDKIYADATTQLGPTGITGETNFTGGTGRFAKIKGTKNPNTGTLNQATGQGTWDETGTVTF